jgi:small subunit ribosomal protein S6
VLVQTYETVFITLPTLTEDDERSTIETMARIVSDGGGSMIANERMGRRRLAYPIRKFEDGVYTRFLYDSIADVPKELERRFRLSDNVLRYLTVTLERNWATAAKEQAVRDAERRAEAEAEAARKAREEAEAAATADAAGSDSSASDSDAPASRGEKDKQGESEKDKQGESEKEKGE